MGRGTTQIIMKKVFLFLTVAAVSAFVSGCGKTEKPEDSLAFNATSFSMYTDDTRQLFEGNLPDVESSHEFVATVLTNGIVTAEHVGTATIRSGSSKCSVTVKPRHNIYPDPYMNWGASKAEVKSVKGTPYTEEADMMMYVLSQYPPILAAYQFENGKLERSSVAMPIVSMPNNFVDFLTERYLPISVDPIAFVHLDEMNEPDLVVLVTFSDDLVMVGYVDGSKLNTRSSLPNTPFSEDLIRKIKELF